MWDAVKLFFGKALAREIAIQVIRWLAILLPIALNSLFIAYRGKRTINNNVQEAFRRYKELKDKDTRNQEAARQWTRRVSEKKKRYFHLSLLLIVLPAVLATVCYFLKGLISYHGNWDWVILFLLFSLLFFIPVLLREPYARNLTGRIATRSSDYLLKTRIPFSFFLRPFETDCYKESNAVESSFDENVLANGLKRRFIRLFSLGNPVELDRPQGGGRVYVVGDWEDAVQKIIRRARHIYMRVGSSEGCVKEFRMVMDVMDKATLIIDEDGFEDYCQFRQEYQNLPSLEPIAGDYVYFVSKDRHNAWVVEKMANTGVAYKHYPAKMVERKSSDVTDYYRGRALKSSLVGIFIVIVVFMLINPKEKDSVVKAKAAKREWVKKHIPKCPVEIDSSLSIQNCDFTAESLMIEAFIPDCEAETIDEEKAVLCFFHLNQYDLEQVRSFYRIVDQTDGSLLIVVDDADKNRLASFEYRTESDFKRLWDICRRMNELRDSQRRKNTREEIEYYRSMIRAY